MGTKKQIKEQQQQWRIDGNKLGDYLRTKRDWHNLSRQQVANATDIDERLLVRIEEKNNNNLTIVALKLMSYYGDKTINIAKLLSKVCDKSD